MGFLHNLFGSAGGGLVPYPTKMNFIPVDGQGNTIVVKGDQAVWMGLENREVQRYAYDRCSALASVIDKLTNYDINGIINVLKLKGKGKNDYLTGTFADNMNRLFTQPNPLQSWEQFRGQQMVYKKTHGFCPVLPIVPVGHPKDFALAWINIPPWTLKPELTGNIVKESTIEGIVRNYSFTILGKTFTVKATEIIMLTDGFTLDEVDLLPKSKLIGLDMDISNLCASLEADNVLLRKKGPLGFIAHDSAATKDAISGYIPMSKPEKEELQLALSGYGLSWDQFQYVISRQAVKWNPMSFNVAELGTKETAIASTKAICHRYELPYVLLEQTDAVYANGNQAGKSVYQDNVIPSAIKDYNKYAIFFKAKENNAKFEIDYSHIPILQQDELKAAQAADAWNTALEKEYKSGLITLNQWLEKRGYDSIGPDGDKRIGEGGNPQPMAVTLGVGGTQSMMEVLNSPTLKAEQKKNALVILFGLDPADAGKLVPEDVEVEVPVPPTGENNLDESGQPSLENINLA